MTRLYLISPARIEHPSIFADELRAALDGGDVAARIQVERMMDMMEREIELLINHGDAL